MQTPFYTKAKCAGYMGPCDSCGDDISGLPAEYWVMTLERGNRRYCSEQCLETDPRFAEAEGK